MPQRLTNEKNGVEKKQIMRGVQRSKAQASNLTAMASNLMAIASNLTAMASNLLAMASNLIAMYVYNKTD